MPSGTRAERPHTRIAGPTADAMSTSTGLLDPTDPANASLPAVTTYLDYMASKDLPEKASTATAGWTVAEVVVAIIKQAQESPEGLTRASIINAARNFNYQPSLARDGEVFKTNGEADGYPKEALQVLQYHADGKTFSNVG